LQQIGSIARKVLADVARAKDTKEGLAGGLEGPAEIQDFPQSPGKSAEERSHSGSGGLDAPPQLTAADREDSCSDGSECVGRADLSTLDFVHVNPKGTARPAPGAPLVGRSREKHAPEDR
jgi:hypothetical protein